MVCCPWQHHLISLVLAVWLFHLCNDFEIIATSSTWCSNQNFLHADVTVRSDDQDTDHVVHPVTIRDGPAILLAFVLSLSAVSTQIHYKAFRMCCYDNYSCNAGRAGLLGADEAIARLREEARLLRERAAEARSRLQSTHVSNLNNRAAALLLILSCIAMLCLHHSPTCIASTGLTQLACS